MHVSTRARIAPPLALLATLATLGTALLLPLPAHAQDADEGIARIVALHGGVTIARGDGAPFAAAVDAPLLADDYVTTGPGAGAEIELAPGTIAHIGESTQLRVARVAGDAQTLQLAEGSIELRAQRAGATVETPSISVAAAAGSDERVAVDTAGETQVAVVSGSADVVTPQGRRTLQPGAPLLAAGPSANPELSGGSSPVAAAPNLNIGGFSDPDASAPWVDDAATFRPAPPLPPSAAAPVARAYAVPVYVPQPVAVPVVLAPAAYAVPVRTTAWVRFGAARSRIAAAAWRGPAVAPYAAPRAPTYGFRSGAWQRFSAGRARFRGR